MKKLTALLLVLAMLVTLAACTKKDEKKEPKDSTAPIETKAPAQLVDAPVLNINEIYGLSPEGQKATLANTLSLTDEDKAAVKEGNYKVAICMHQMDNDVNVMKVNTIKKILGDLGVEIIAVTDGQSSVEQMTTNLETVIAMKPNAIISIAYDVNAMVGIFEKVRDAGIKLVFFECAPTGFVSGQDYYALVSTDYYGSGRFAAEYMAYLLNYEGTVAMVYYDADVWTCNERDDAFRKVMDKYPNIKIVSEQGFADVSQADTCADAILAQYPDVDGIYATWDVPAEEVMASASAVGRNDLIITTVDLGDNAARVIAEDGMIKAVGAARSYEDGEAIAYATVYSLLDKELTDRYVATPTQGVARENVLDAYANCYQVNPSDMIIEIWEAVYGTWTSPLG